MRAGDMPEWYDDALCAQVDPGLFYPPKGGSVADVLKVCRACDVREKCLQYALDNEEAHGVWGATTPMDRRKIRRDLRNAS